MRAKIETVQFVAFTQVPLIDNASGWWPRLFQQPLTSFSTFGPATVAMGLVDGLQVQVHVQPNRVDIIATGQPPQNAMVPAAPPNIPDLKMATAILRPAIEAVCAAAAIIRLACIVQTSEQVASEQDAMSTISSALKIRFSDNSTDLNFQINVKKLSAAQPGMQLNRLCRWGTAKVGFMALPMNPFGFPSPPAFNGSLVDVATSYIDINTPADVAIVQSNIHPLMDEIVHEVENVLEGGYDYL